MEIHLRLDLRCNIKQGSSKGSPIYVLLPYLGSTRVNDIHPSLRRRKVMVVLLKSLLVLNVVEDIKASI